MTAAVHPPTGPAYSLVLVLHIVAAAVGLAAVVATGVQAVRARRGPSAAGAEGVRRYFRVGFNAVGRVLYGVPILGFTLIAISHGTVRAGDGFVVTGLVLWVASTLVAEVALWPGEQRIQRIVSSPGWRCDDPALAEECRRVATAAVLVASLLVVAAVVMVAQP